MGLDELITEARAQRPDYDLSSTAELVELMNREDASVPGAVGEIAAELAEAIEAVVERLRGGGRLIYVGAGSSGQISALDAEECEATFSTEPGQVTALVAGAGLATSEEREAAEDDGEAGRHAVAGLGVSARDAVVGVGASGRTPYAVGARTAARRTSSRRSRLPPRRVPSPSRSSRPVTPSLAAWPTTSSPSSWVPNS